MFFRRCNGKLTQCKDHTLMGISCLLTWKGESHYCWMTLKPLNEHWMTFKFYFEFRRVLSYNFHPACSIMSFSSCGWLARMSLVCGGPGLNKSLPVLMIRWQPLNTHLHMWNGEELFLLDIWIAKKALGFNGRFCRTYVCHHYSAEERSNLLKMSNAIKFVAATRMSLKQLGFWLWWETVFNFVTASEVKCVVDFAYWPLTSFG